MSCKEKQTCSRETEAQKVQASFAKIMTTLEIMNNDMRFLHKSLDDLSATHIEHERKTFKNNQENQERINFMNYRILEVRQLTRDHQSQTYMAVAAYCHLTVGILKTSFVVAALCGRKQWMYCNCCGPAWGGPAA